MLTGQVSLTSTRIMQAEHRLNFAGATELTNPSKLHMLCSQRSVSVGTHLLLKLPLLLVEAAQGCCLLPQ